MELVNLSKQSKNTARVPGVLRRRRSPSTQSRASGMTLFRPVSLFGWVSFVTLLILMSTTAVQVMQFLPTPPFRCNYFFDISFFVKHELSSGLSLTDASSRWAVSVGGWLPLQCLETRLHADAQEQSARTCRRAGHFLRVGHARAVSRLCFKMKHAISNS